MMARKTSKTFSPGPESKIFALIGYLSILCIIPLLLKHEDEFIRFHSKQGLVIFLIEVAGFILHIMLGYWLLRLTLFVAGIFSFIGIIKVLQGQKVKFPVITGLADKLEI